MNDQTIIVLIIAVVVGIVLIIFRGNLSRVGFRTKKFKADMETRNPGAINITKSSQEGENNEIDVNTGDVNISEFDQKGKEHKLSIKKD